MTASPPEMLRLRAEYHKRVFQNVLRVDGRGILNNADSGSKLSMRLSQGIAERVGLPVASGKPLVQHVGKAFEEATVDFLREGFALLKGLRPGRWDFIRGGRIANFDQYAHLADLERLSKQNRELRAALGDYIVKPDILVARLPEPDSVINKGASPLVVREDEAATRTPLRKRNSERAILHASISCKWTLRNDRSQNARTEGLNLLRNRKGRTPHIAIVTADPAPNHLGALALGTGDIDCVYHFALYELQDAAKSESNNELLDDLVSGRRLRDVSDLPFDLAI